MLQKYISKILDRFGGLAAAIAVNAIVLIVLINLVIFEALDTGREVQVQVMEHEEIPEIEQALQKLDELPPDSNLMTAPGDVPALPDVPVEMSAPDMPDLAGLAMHEIQSPLVMQGLFAGRSAGARSNRLQQFAGGYGEQVEAAVMRSLEWLAAQQTPEGYWGAVSAYNQSWHQREWIASMMNEQRATRLTALALLAFLAHGETPASEQFGGTVQRAIEYLLSQQQPDSGLFVPLAAVRPEKSGEDLGVYAHAQATYALAEAYALTRAPALKASVEKGIRVISAGQLHCGAWGNWYEQDIADASATSWQVQALRAAEAAGILLPEIPAALERAAQGVAFLYKGNGIWFYRKGDLLIAPREGGPVMSGAMVLSLQLLGLHTDPMVSAGLRYMHEFGVSDWETAWLNPINKSLPATYEWYYNTQAVFQRGGSRWKTWNAKFAPMLLSNQHAEGWWLGPNQKTGEEKIYSTALCSLSLQVYYRILPSFSPPEHRAPRVTFDDDVIITIR
ncbi:MAG: hypothetical protein WC959_04620 [Kiritimatiellales bacterium]